MASKFTIKQSGKVKIPELSFCCSSGAFSKNKPMDVFSLSLPFPNDGWSIELSDELNDFGGLCATDKFNEQIVLNSQNFNSNNFNLTLNVDGIYTITITCTKFPETNIAGTAWLTGKDKSGQEKRIKICDHTDDIIIIA